MRRKAARPDYPRLLRLRDVEQFAGIKRTQIYEHVQDGTFPRPIKITEGGRAIAWAEEELMAWREERMAARDQQGGAMMDNIEKMLRADIKRPGVTQIARILGRKPNV